MTDKEKYDFIDHVVHLTLFEEDRLLDEHGGEYSELKEDGIDSNEYYRIITERVINILKKNNNYMQEEPVTDIDFEQELYKAFGQVKDFTLCAQIAKKFYEIGRLSNVERTTKNWKEPVSEGLEEASKEWLSPQLDKSYANYGETKQMELTHFDGYAMLDAIEFGAKWQKKKTLKESEDAIQYVRENHSPSEVSDFQNAMNIAVMKAFDAGKEKMREQMMKNAVNGLVYAQRTNGEVMFRSNYVRKEGFEFGDKVKLIIIKED